MGRTLTFKIFRYNPTKDNDQPHIESYQLEETPRLNIFTALNIIKTRKENGLEIKITKS